MLSGIDEFKIKCGDRLRSIGFDDSRLVFEAAIKAYIPPDKAADALVERSLRKETTEKVDIGPSLLDDLRAYFGTIVLEDIGLFKWSVFLGELEE